jgi:hypothetical protein
MKGFDHARIGFRYCSLPKPPQHVVVVSQDLAKIAAIIAVCHQLFHHDIVDFAHAGLQLER